MHTSVTSVSGCGGIPSVQGAAPKFTGKRGSIGRPATTGIPGSESQAQSSSLVHGAFALSEPTQISTAQSSAQTPLGQSVLSTQPPRSFSPPKQRLTPHSLPALSQVTVAKQVSSPKQQSLTSAQGCPAKVPPLHVFCLPSTQTLLNRLHWLRLMHSSTSKQS